MNTDSIKGQARCIQTLVQVEAPSLETSKFSLYFQVVLSQSIRSFRTYFPQNFELFSIDFSVKSITFSTGNSKYFVYTLQQLPSMRRTHFGNPTWINSISSELLPPLTCERACSGNDISSYLMCIFPIIQLQMPNYKKKNDAYINRCTGAYQKHI